MEPVQLRTAGLSNDEIALELTRLWMGKKPGSQTEAEIQGAFLGFRAAITSNKAGAEVTPYR